MTSSVLIWKAPLILGMIGSIYFVSNYKHFSFLQLIMGWFVVFTFSCELISSACAAFKLNNLFMVHVYTLGAFLFCGFFFQRLFRLQGWNFFKSTYLYAGALLIILSSIFIQDISTFNSYSKTISQLVIIILCVTAYSLMTIREYTLPDKESIKIFIAAILLSCAMSITLYLFSEQILEMEKQTQRKIWLINVFINGLVQILFMYGFYKQLKKE